MFHAGLRSIRIARHAALIAAAEAFGRGRALLDVRSECMHNGAQFAFVQFPAGLYASPVPKIDCAVGCKASLVWNRSTIWIAPGGRSRRTLAGR